MKRCAASANSGSPRSSIGSGPDSPTTADPTSVAQQPSASSNGLAGSGMVVPDPANPLLLAEGCCATEVGSAVVGESGPLPIEDLGEPLFADAAHRFIVFLPAYRAAQLALLAEAR